MTRKWNHKKGRSAGRFVMLSDWLQDTPAWARMKPGPRALYFEMKRLFLGHNNGEIFLSVRDAASKLNVTKDTAAGYFDELERRGFITKTEGGHLGPSGIGKAAKWALQEEVIGTTPAPKGFMRWREIQNPVQKTRLSRPDNPDTS